MIKELGIIGCGGHARSIADIAIDNEPDIKIIFFDENAKPNERIFGATNGYPVIPLSDIDGNDDIKYIVAIGDNHVRKQFVEKHNGIKVCSIISQRAYISKFAEMGIDVFVGEGAHIGPEAFVGNHCIINNAAVVEHEVKVGDYCHISVNSTVCGRCKIGNEVFVGAGAVIKDYINVCDNVVIGANAVVVKDITIPGIYIGNPARRKEI